MARYLAILAGFVIVPLLLAMGVVLTLPWLYAESSRLTRLELVLTNLAEAAALAWFVYFAIRFAFTKDLESAFGESVVRDTVGQWIGMVVALAFIVDLSATFVFQSQESRRKADAKSGVCEIQRVKRYSTQGVSIRSDDPTKTLDTKLVFTAFAWCELVDERGRRYPVYYYGSSGRYPKKVHDAILNDDRRAFPIDVRAKYDPKFPYRFWLVGVEDDRWDGWRFSQEVTIWALVCSLVIVVLNYTLLQSAVPLEICPLLGVTLRFLLAGMDMWLNGQTALPPF